MKIAVKYMAQVRHAAGVSSEEVEVAAGCSVPELLTALAAHRGEALRRLLLESSGSPHRAILVFVGERQATTEAPVDLRDGDVVTILSPMAGG
jgi:molybdopterin converting factor small subunit